MAKTLFNISDKIVAGDTPGELLAYRDRIIADGGTLETFAETEAEIRRLQSLGLYDSLSLGYVAGGYKASKWYNIKGATGDLNVVRATNGTRQNRSGLIDTLGNNLTRADFEDGVLKGNWVESAATNLLLHSQAFDNAAWSLIVGTIVSTTATAPDGTATATRVRMGADNVAFLRQTLSDISSGTFNASLFIKQVNGVSAFIDIGDNKSVPDIFPTSEWVRYDATAPWNASARFVDLEFRGTDGVAEVDIWGAQLETGSRASTYIKTTTATATRNADNISKTGIASEIGQTEGVIYTEVDTRLLGRSENSRIIAVSDGTGANCIRITKEPTEIIRLVVLVGGIVQANIVTAINQVGVLRIACEYGNNDFSFVINGATIGTDTSGSVPVCSQLFIGKVETSTLSTFFNDRFYSAYLWKDKKGVPKLQQLTTL